MRLCHFDLKYDRSNPMPSGTHIQVVTSCTRLPATLWQCRCDGKVEHTFDWYGQTAARAEFRHKVLRILRARLLDQVDNKNTRRHNRCMVHLSVHTRVDKQARTYVQPPKNGPSWDHVKRRVTYDLDTKKVIQDLLVQDQPTGYDWLASLPEGVRNISTRFYWEPPEPVLLGDNCGTARPRARMVTFIEDDRSPPLSIGRGHTLPTNDEFSHDPRLPPTLQSYRRKPG